MANTTSKVSSGKMPTTTSTLPPKIPLFYRAIIFGFEASSALAGVFLVLLTPDAYLDSYIPHDPNISRDARHDLLLHHLAGLFFVIFFMQAVVLGMRPRDVGLWRMVHLGLFGWDLIFGWLVFRNLANQGRLSPLEWRAQDWSPMMVVPTMFVRASIALGIGMPKEKRKEE